MEFHWVGWLNLTLFSVSAFFYIAMMFVINWFRKIITENQKEINKKQISRSLFLMHFAIVWMLFRQAASQGLYSYTWLNGLYVEIAIFLIYAVLVLRSLNQLIRITNGLPAKEPKLQWYENNPNKKEWYEKNNDHE